METPDTYDRNRYCGCPRCCMASYVGPAVLVTLGVLFLVDDFTRLGFERSWPLLLIVIGVVKILQWNAPVTGHVQPPLPPGAVPPPGPPPEAPKSTDQQVPHA